ncbi:MAG TPA: glycine cleavage system protein GcvH [Acidimicrobiales bacterium]|nr:glycine cleavage system protein GcvH [Acidimicrobiales bacterium]
MNTPEELRYTTDHEWARSEGGAVRVGITDFAQDALGDVVFVKLPTAGTTVSKGDSLGEIESTKSVSDIYAPMSGEIVEVNLDLTSEPERVNEDPYGEGWICAIAPSAPSELESLLSAEKYRELTST